MKFKTQTALTILATGWFGFVGNAIAQDASPAPQLNPLAANPQTTFDTSLHLLVDPDSILESDGITLIVNQAVKYPEPIITSSWLPNRMACAWGNVIREPSGLFRMWYLDNNPSVFELAKRKVWGDGSDYGYYPQQPGDYRDVEHSFICYAESRDGIHWTKPELGLIEFQGSKQNNIVYSGHDVAKKTNRALTNMDGSTVVRDDTDPDPARRYKMFAYWETLHKYDNRHCGLHRPEEDIKRFRKAAGHYVACSPDGIHFGDLEPSGLPMTGADRNLVIRDHKRNQWRAIIRPKIPANEYAKYIRGTGICTSSDSRHWSELQTIFVPDELDGFGADQQIDVFIPFNYGVDDIAFINIWNFRGKTRETFLACLQANGTWKRLYRDQPVISRGAPGAFDRILVVPLQNEPILVDDQMFLYYTADSGNDNHPAGKRSIGLARLRRDAFVGAAAGDNKPKSERNPQGESFFITRPIKVSAPNLAVNFEKYAPASTLRIALLDENKNPIPDYTLDDCLPVVADSIRSPVEWKNQKNLQPLLGKNIHIRASFAHGVVYAFRFYE